jgi:hypothetical protein
LNATLTYRSDRSQTECRADKRMSAEARTRCVAAVVASIYFAIAASTPLIVRFSPLPDDRSVVAVADRIDHPRCAIPSESAAPCTHLLPRAHPSAPTVADL